MAELTFGSVYFSGTAMETSLGVDSPAKATGTTTPMQLSGFTTPANNRLVYTGAVERVFEATFVGSIEKDIGTSSLVTLALYKEDVAIPGASVTHTIAAEGVIDAVAVTGQVQLALNEYVELWVSTDTGDNITVFPGILAIAVLG